MFDMLFLILVSGIFIFFLSFIDAASRCTWVYPMKFRDDLLEGF